MATTTTCTTNTPTTVDVKDARARFDEMIASSGKIDTRVIIERDGVPIGALVPTEDLNGLTQRDEQIAENLRFLADFRSGFADASEDEIEREGLKSLAEVDADRAERRARGEIV